MRGGRTLAAWAALTQRIRVGLTVGANTFRNPGVVAKMAVTIDHISGGRSVLGLGAGNVAFENLAHGIDPGRTLGEWLDWFEEALQIVIDLLDGKEVTHRSAKYQFDHVRHNPRPLQAHVPVIIGAEGERRGLRIAARHADIWQSFFGTGDGAVAHFRHKDLVLRRHCEDLGRDPAPIERMVGCKLIIKGDAETAQRVACELVAVHRWDDSVWDVLWAGTSQQVADWLTPFVEAGAGSFAPQIGWPYDHETLERLIGEVKPIVDARVG